MDIIMYDHFILSSWVEPKTFQGFLLSAYLLPAILPFLVSSSRVYNTIDSLSLSLSLFYYESARDLISSTSDMRATFLLCFISLSELKFLHEYVDYLSSFKCLDSNLSVPSDIIKEWVIYSLLKAKEECLLCSFPFFSFSIYFSICLNLRRFRFEGLYEVVFGN